MTGCTAGVNGQCGFEIYAKGMCKAHYAAKLQGRPTDKAIKRYAKHNAQSHCSAEGCSREFYANGKCRMHYSQDYRKSKKLETEKA